MYVRLLSIICLSVLLAGCGGGGGGGSSSTDPPLPTFTLEGHWTGTYYDYSRAQSGFVDLNLSSSGTVASGTSVEYVNGYRMQKQVTGSVTPRQDAGGKLYDGEFEAFFSWYGSMPGEVYAVRSDRLLLSRDQLLDSLESYSGFGSRVQISRLHDDIIFK